MADLISTARAKFNLNNLATTSDEDATLAALVTACSKAIRRLCRREFDSQAFDELYAGDGQEKLLLRQFPVLALSRVAYGPTSVLRITNTSAANQRATVAVTAAGLSLTRVASGVSSTDTTVTWVGNATLTAVVNAVNALGNGWSAALASSDFALRASADLRAVQGAINALNVTAYLRLHVHELGSFSVEMQRGWLTRPGGWPGGADFWRILYTAGYATVPEDVQEACAEWVAALFWQTKRDPGLSQESIPGAVSRIARADMPSTTRVLLETYRDWKL